MDSYSLFIERGFKILQLNGTLVYIVPISITSSDSATGIHNLLKANCAEIRVSSYAVRPQPIFTNATVNTSILSFVRTNTPCVHLYASKMYRKDDENTISTILSSLSFVPVESVCMYGRIPKIGTSQELAILQKLKKLPTIADFLAKEKAERDKQFQMYGKRNDPERWIYYRVVGGRYFKIVTPYSTGSTKEVALPLIDNNEIGACLSSNLGFWYYQIYSDNLSWPMREITSFPIPPLTSNDKVMLRQLYVSYLDDVEKHANTYKTVEGSSYKMGSFKTYHIGKSKALIDRIDDFIGPLYGLTKEEIEFIKNYERRFRLSAEDESKDKKKLAVADDDEEEA